MYIFFQNGEEICKMLRLIYKVKSINGMVSWVGICTLCMSKNR